MMTLRDFIKQHRAELDDIINRAMGRPQKRNDDERRLWIVNDEGLYAWAKDEGVKL